MANTGAKVAVAAGVVGGVVAIHSWWIGEAVELRFRSSVQAVAEQSGYRVSLERYERGVFTSEAETILELPLPAAASDDLRRLLPTSLRLRMLHRISHGPGLDGLRSARMLSTPSFDGEELAKLREIYGNNAPFSVKTDFGYGDDATIELRSPSVETKIAGAQPVELEWAGIEGDFSVDGGRVAGRLFAPKLLLRGEAANFGMAALSWTMDLRRSAAASFWTGDTELRAASVDLSVPEARLQLQRPSFQTKTTEERLATTTSASLAADRIDTSGGAVDRPALRMRVERLDADALATIGEALRRRAGAPAATLAELDASLAEVRPMVDRLVSQRPELRLDELSMRLPQGAVRATGQLRYVGDGVLADFVPADLEAEATIEMPAALLDVAVERIAYAQAASAAGAAGSQAPLDEPALRRAAADLRSAWQREGWIEIDGDRVRSRLELREGRVLLNGHAFGTPT